MNANRFKVPFLLLALVVMLVIPALSVSAQAGTIGAVNTGRLNVRTGPSMAYDDLTSIPYNTEVVLLGRATGTTWVQIRLPNAQVGWVNFLYLRSYAMLDSLPITWTTTVPPTNPYPAPGGQTYYTVKAGDSLKTIAARFGTTWQQLAALNNLADPNYIYVGQQLVIYGAVTQPTTPQTNPGVHIVQAGETLQTIGQRYGIAWTTIATANNITNPNYVYVGQRLVIPTVQAAPRYYTVQQGDHIYEIARRYGINASLIIAANNLGNASLIYPGQVLVIP